MSAQTEETVEDAPMGSLQLRKPEGGARRLFEVITNVATVITCGVICYSLLAHVPSKSAQRPAQPVPLLTKGDQLPFIDGVRFDRAERSLLLFLRSTCRYCAESVPFYQRLARELSEKPGKSLQLIVIDEEDALVGTRYLRQNGLDSLALAILPAGTAKNLKVPGTPALVLARKDRIVENVWFGRLDPNGESDVEAAMSGKTPN